MDYLDGKSLYHITMISPSLIEKTVDVLEKTILLFIAAATTFAVGEEILKMVSAVSVKLSDLFLLFIYAEVIGMIGAFYKDHRIPVTLPVIIAMTALCRMIILQSKDVDAINIMFESGGILILAISAYIMSLKDKMSLQKLKLREDEERAPPHD